MSTDASVRTDGGAVRRDALLARRFVSLADTLVDDYDVVELLDGLVTSCVELLGVAAAGLLLTDQRGDLQLVASTSEATRLVEAHQLENQEGPCLEAVRTGRQVAVPDLSAMQARWPLFAASAAAVGFGSVHACPCGCARRPSGRWTCSGPRRCPSARPTRPSRRRWPTSRRPASSSSGRCTGPPSSRTSCRLLIEQAKGVVAAHGGVDMDGAINALRSFARGRSSKLGVVAAQVVRREISPEELLGGSPS